jgi:hypothetical protein
LDVADAVHSLTAAPRKGVSAMSETTALTSQVTGDLECNLKEQERLSGEIEAL